MYTRSPALSEGSDQNGVARGHPVGGHGEVTHLARPLRAREVSRAQIELGQRGALDQGEPPVRAEGRDGDERERLPVATSNCNHRRPENATTAESRYA
jgi:hypothetical protein